MAKLRFFLIIVPVFLLIGGVTAFAAPDSANRVAIANNGLCPCGNPSHDDIFDTDIDTETGTSTEDTGSENADNGNTDHGCNHPNLCIVCDDCLDCGNNPCIDCCEDTRRCGDCCCDYCGDICDSCGSCLECGDACIDCCEDKRRCGDCCCDYCGDICDSCGSCLECGDACIDCCDDRRRCGDCSCDYCGDFCDLLPVRGSIFVDINDDFLRIGSGLSFTTNADASDYLIQWRVDGEDIDGANGLTYIVRPFDVDKNITVVLISLCCNDEAESPPTDYVPYTINLLPGMYVPMGTDDVFFGSPGIFTAYAASKNDGFVDISYVLYDCGLDSDDLTFSLSTIPDISSVGTGSVKYRVIPSDAVNGIISIIATFYHRGVLVTPADGFVFDDLDCGYSFDDYYTLTIAQLGNAPTGPITINISGDDYEAFYLCTYNIPNIDINDSVTIDAGVKAGIEPPGYYDNTYIASIDVSGSHLNVHAIPVSVRIAHDDLSFLERWTNADAVNHSRERSCSACNIFMRTELHAHIWGNWGIWTQGDVNNHHRTGSCTAPGCGRAAVVGSTAGTFAAHTWGTWSNHDANNHRRICTTAGCTRPQDQAHTWGGWTNHDATNHRRICTTPGCTRPQDQAHIWGGWTNHDATNHRRTCTTPGCARPQDQAHIWGGWTNHDATNHRRTCTTPGCARPQDQAHTWGGWSPISATQHRSTCTTCSRIEYRSHDFNKTDSWRNTDNEPHLYQHNFRCSGCFRLMSGNYACVHNEQGICVDSIYLFDNYYDGELIPFGPVNNTRPGIGCGRDRNAPNSPNLNTGPGYFHQAPGA